MSLRLRCAVSFVALASFAFAGDQAAGSQSKWPHFHFGGFSMSAGYSHFSGPAFYPYFGYLGPASLAYGPYFYDPFLLGYVYPGFYTGYAYRPSMGEVKIQAPNKTSWVYLNGALAGRADKLKSMWLDPGKYTISIRDGSRKVEQNIYVLSGKTLKLTPEMLAQERP